MAARRRRGAGAPRPCAVCPQRRPSVRHWPSSSGTTDSPFRRIVSTTTWPTLRVGLAGLRVSAEGSPDEPFFEADVCLGGAAGRHSRSATSRSRTSASTNGRVFVHRRADGSSNLPRSEDSPGDDPPALRIDRIDVPRLAVEVRDEQADLALQVPAIGFVLTPDEGSIALAQPAEVRCRQPGRPEFRSSKEGRRFDGRALHLTATDVRTDDASMTVDGTVAADRARVARVDVTVNGTADAGAACAVGYRRRRSAAGRGHLSRDRRRTDGRSGDDGRRGIRAVVVARGRVQGSRRRAHG